MADEFLTFEAKDVQILGEETFNEEVQREESRRFYTLNEQVTDAYDKLIPRGKRATKFELEQLAKETERYREMYSTYITATDDSYRFNESGLKRTLDWVSPVYASDEAKVYDWRAFNSLFSKEALRLPNAYPRMIASLPRPYADAGHLFPFSKPVTSYNSEGAEPRRYLPDYVATATRRNEDETYSILPRPIQGSGDQLGFVGYFLKARADAIPNAQAGHSFFEDNKPRFIETTAPLADILPGEDAVMTHGVPVTKDPYGEGQKYLKLYDIALADVKWSLWKQRFPPVPVLQEKLEVIPLAFPEHEREAPPKSLVEEYGVPHFPGVAMRKWFMNQEDGGLLVGRMLLSTAANAGVAKTLLTSELGEIKFPPVTPDSCSLMGLPFDQFRNNGTLRRFEMNGKYSYECIPLDVIMQERYQLGFKNRIPWKDSTANDILNPYRRILARYKRAPQSTKAPALSKSSNLPTSQKRQQILAVLEDKRRLPDDKNRDIQVLLRDAIHAKEQYTDKEGLFVMCDHSVAILQGHLAEDRLAFYAKWTAVVDGFRVCRVCGEQISNDVLVDQDEFNDDGRLQKHGSSLPTAKFNGDSVASYSRSLANMQPLFVMTDPSDSTVFLIMSLLQVLPDPAQLVPVLQFARTISTALGAKVDNDASRRARGMVGIATVACLLQIHMPGLVPRRAFGPKPLVIDGYPRDTDKSDGFTVVDSLLMVMRKTFESYPSSFQGPSLQIMRASINESKSLRTQINATLGKFTKQFANQYDKAKTEAALRPPAPEPYTMIPTLLPPAELGAIKNFAPCPSFRLTWISPQLPRIRQEVVPIRSNITAAPLATHIVRPAVRPPTRLQIPVADISKRLKIPIPAKMGIEPTDSWRTNSLIIEHLSSALLIPTQVSLLDTTLSPDLLRDITKGFLRELLSTIASNPEKKRMFDEMRQKDMTLYTLTMPVTTARTEANTLRAKETHVFTDRMRAMTDADREVAKMLLDRGLGPFIITNKDRASFAAELATHVEPIPEYGEEYEEMPGPADPAAESYDMNGEDTFIDGEDNVPPLGNRETEQVYAEGDD